MVGYATRCHRRSGAARRDATSGRDTAGLADRAAGRPLHQPFQPSAGSQAFGTSSADRGTGPSWRRSSSRSRAAPRAGLSRWIPTSTRASSKHATARRSMSSWAPLPLWAPPPSSRPHDAVVGRTAEGLAPVGGESGRCPGGSRERRRGSPPRRPAPVRARRRPGPACPPLPRRPRRSSSRRQDAISTPVRWRRRRWPIRRPGAPGAEWRRPRRRPCRPPAGRPTATGAGAPRRSRSCGS